MRPNLLKERKKKLQRQRTEESRKERKKTIKTKYVTKSTFEI